jgi:hypothetical protein
MYLFHLHWLLLHDIGQVCCYTYKDKITIYTVVYNALKSITYDSNVTIFTIDYNKI